MKQMQMTHGSRQWGGRAALMVFVLVGLWCATSAQAAEKVTLGPWFRIGPLRDQPPLLNWMDNVASSFKHEFGPGKDIGSDHRPKLEKTYPTTHFPATPKAIRGWKKHLEWIDGYYQELPRGPAPSAGETQYLYRTIRAPKPTKIMLDFIIRSPESDRRMNQKGMEYWRRTGRYRCLLDGKEILRWEGKGDMPRPVEVSLSAGTHHFLAKVTNNRHSYGFAFSIKGMHPELRHEVGFERPWRPLVVDLPTEWPYYVEGEKIAPSVLAEQRYSQGVRRLRALKFHPEPMPGVEAAARNSKGQIVPAMEAALEKYPTSPAGDRHTARLAKLEKTVKPLLAKIDQTGQLHQTEVLAAVAMLEQMWAETIGELPTLIYLERPTYVYDSMMYERSGTDDAVIKTFDPRSRTVETILDFETATPKTKAHEINMSWDGKRVWIGGGGQVSAVNRDGTNLRAIQKGQSPCEMPDGRIVFFDRATGQSPCKGTGPRRLLYTSDADGKNRKLVSGNTCIDTAPSIMNDGRILFTRWDYGVNKNVFNRHALWTQNPDGTGIDLFFGNTIVDPRSFCRARQVPGRPEVLTIFGPHHARLAGLMGLVWNGNGKEAGDGLGFRRITHDTASVGDRPPTWAYQDAYPLNEQLFLVTFGGRAKHKAGLYLYDRSGNRKCVLEAASERGIHSAQRLVPINKPMAIPSRSNVPNWKPGVDLHKRLLDDPNWKQKATLTVQDVYQGLEPEIKRGQIKYIAVMEQPAQSHGRGGAIGVGTIWYVNRFLGLVPVEADGSAFFEVPAMRSLYFHVLDKNGKMLMTQGSDFHTMPGEIRSCIGCHEQRKGITSPPDTGRMRLAMKKAPVQPKLPNWGTRGIIEYETVVQPVFDKYCIKCHSGEKPKGRLNLTGDKTTAYNMSYMQLTDGQYVHFTPGTGSTHAQPSNDCDEQAPLSRGSVLSTLTKYIENPKHCKKTIPFDDRLKVFLWIDSNVPYYSHYRQVADTRLSRGAIGRLKDVHKRRCATCHDPRKRMPDEKSGLNRHHIARHVGGLAGQWGVADSGMRVRHLNLSNPSHSAALQAPLAKSAGGWGMCTTGGKPVFADKNDPDYKLILKSLGQIEIRKGIEYKGIKKLLKERKSEPPAKDSEKSCVPSSIRIEFTIDGKAVPADISYKGTKGDESSKASTAIRLQRGVDYRFGIEYEQGGEIYRHCMFRKVDWAGLRRVSIAFSKIKKQGPLKYATVNGKMTIVGCDRSVKSIVIPEDIEGQRVMSIGRFAFDGCRKMTSMTFPHSVTSIGGFAFTGCERLTSMSISKSVTSIGHGAFGDCSGLVGFIVERGNPAYVSREGVLLTKGGKTLVRYPAGRKNAPYTIPKSVTSIGESAFSSCEGLTSVTIPNSVASIGKYAFTNCGGLTSVTIPNSVALIGDATFANCGGLRSVTIPNSVTSIWAGAFATCDGLLDFTVAPGNSAYVSREGVLLTKDGKTLVRYPAGRKDAAYTIPDSVTSIGYSAFGACSGLTSVTIPNSVTSIGAWAFSDCRGLTSVTIPKGVKIGRNAFEECPWQPPSK